MILKRIGVLSALRFGMFLYFALGVIFLGIYGVAVIAMGLLQGNTGHVLIGLLVMVGGPILYGVLGGLGTALMALLYNLSATLGFPLSFEFSEE